MDDKPQGTMRCAYDKLTCAFDVDVDLLLRSEGPGGTVEVGSYTTYIRNRRWLSER